MVNALLVYICNTLIELKGALYYILMTLEGL